MAILDAGMHLAGQQIDPGQQAECAMALVLMVACKAGVNPRLRRQVGCGVADRLDAWFLVIGDDGDVAGLGFGCTQNRNLSINADTSAILLSNAASRRSR